MRADKKLMLCTALELAEHLQKTLQGKKLCKENFQPCDFCIVDIFDDHDDLEAIRSCATGWYGIKSIDSGFDSNDIVIIGDYYSGGSAVIGSLYEGMGSEEIVYEINRIITSLLQVGGMDKCNLDVSILVEWKEDDENQSLMWRKYISYLSKWAGEHSHPIHFASSPASFEKWCDNEYEKEGKR